MKSWFAGEAFAVIHVKNFRFYLFYRIFMTMASLMQSVIVGWQIYALSHNVLWLGFIGLAEVIPQVSISLFAGHYIDLWNRRKIVHYTTLLLILGSVILLVYSSTLLISPKIRYHSYFWNYLFNRIGERNIKSCSGCIVRPACPEKFVCKCGYLE